MDGWRSPYGYDIADRALVINEFEAKVVRRVFRDTASGAGATAIARELNAEGITTKQWMTQGGRQRLGGPVDKKFVARMLRNRIYIGEVSHQGQWHPGVHEAILSSPLWQEVESVLARASRARAGMSRHEGRTDALLRGLLFDAEGNKMYPTFTRKSGKAYLYYISKRERRFGKANGTAARIASQEIEPLVLEQVHSVLSSPEALEAIIRELDGVDEPTALIAMSSLGESRERLFPAERHRLIHLLIERMTLEDEGLRIRWHPVGWQALLGEFEAATIGSELLDLEQGAA